MKDRKKLIKTFVAVAVIVFFFGGALALNNYNARFKVEERSFVSMDTVVTEKVYARENALIHITPIMELVKSLDEKLSRFSSDSAVSRLNRGERVNDIALSSVIDSVKKISEETEGAFDVTVGALADLWSIGEDSERIPSEKEIKKLLSDIDSTKLMKDEADVYYKGKGILDLGSVGKGYACDMVKAYLESTEAEGAVVSVGGSVLAYGDYNNHGSKWRIAVRHPRNENEFLGVVSLDEGFVSTSGDYERYFEKDGVRYHHIFDAKTGYPASSGLISVTVVAGSGLLSDALSTACFILGEEKGKALIEKYNAGAVFVDEDMNITRVGEIEFEEQ